MSRKSEIIPIDRRQGHPWILSSYRGRGPDEIFLVVDRRPIASRGQPGAPEAGIWVLMVSGYTVLDKNGGEDIVVFFDGKVHERLPTLPLRPACDPARALRSPMLRWERLLCTVALGGRINFVSCGSGSDAVASAPASDSTFCTRPPDGVERGGRSTNGHG